MTDSVRLSRSFVELADTLVDDFDVVEFMSGLTTHCVDILDADEAGVMLADPHGTLKAIASSSERALLLELYELQTEEGPCYDCYRTGAPLVNQSLESPDR